jgi:ABC-2 type transport system permease protein
LVLQAVAGVATGLGYAIRAGGMGHWVAAMLGAGLAQVPATLVIAAIAGCAFGLSGRASVAVGWTAFGLALALSLFGTILQLSQRVLDVSPFTHIPHLPGGAFSGTPLIALTVIALALCAVGLAGLRRRDITP